MLLSEAIKLGSLLGPQQHGSSFGPNNASCALGAAALAMGIRQVDSPVPGSQTLLGVFPGLNKAIFGTTLAVIIARLNDYDKLTREQIADRLVRDGLDCESVDLLAITQTPEEKTVCC